MWDILQRFFAYRPENVIGVDIGDGSVKVVELDRQNGRPVIKCIGITDIPAGTIANGYCQDINTLTEVIRQAVNVSGASYRDAVLSIGSPSLFIREVVYPPMTPVELAEAVKWDSEKYVPFAPDSYYLDFTVAGQGESELEMPVLLTAAPREIIDNIVTAVKGAGLTPVAIDGEPLALHRTLIGAENSVVVDIGADLSRVSLFQKGRPVVTRPIPIGSKRFTEVIMETLELEIAEAERFKQRQKGLLQHQDKDGEESAVHRNMELLASELVREASRTAEYYRMQNKNVVLDKLILTGGGAKLDNLAQYFAAHTSNPVIVHDPLAAIDISPALDPQYVRGLSLQLGVAVGLALRGGAV